MLALRASPLLALLSAWPAHAAPSPPTDRVTIQDRQSYYRGSYQAHASPWAAYLDKALVHRVDYEDVVTIRTSTFPNGTIFDTRWPTRAPTKSGVWGYHALSYGNYDGGRPPVAVVPRRVRDIRQLSHSFAFRHSGSGYFNLLTEFYLTSRAGDENAKLIEIGYFLHAPKTTVDFAADGRFIGKLRDRKGRLWRISMQDRFCMILPETGETVTSGTIDIRPVLAFLTQKGILTGDEWFNGIAFGMEPTPGGGKTRLVVDRWRVDYR